MVTEVDHGGRGPKVGERFPDDLWIRSQTCNATECLPPSSMVTTLTIPEAPTPQ